MTLSEMSYLITKCEALGLIKAHLTMRYTQKNINHSRRVRTPFGLCEWYPSTLPGQIIIYPTVVQMKKYIKKAMKNGTKF